ncbi:uncharacterized protein LOC119073893 [Bradysia coprophila]|uniref:uncharacterized protein LOC119073893 n=1 Tax=Bradysia coprophila TaxID=38358 RepID=UPI00187DA4DE|nr:uncharacterized protein LOC119073893 [Bradysia coprophila]
MSSQDFIDATTLSGLIDNQDKFVTVLSPVLPTDSFDTCDVSPEPGPENSSTTDNRSRIVICPPINHHVTDTLHQPSELSPNVVLSTNASKHRRHTSILYQNVRGLRTKTKEFKLSSTGCDHDALALTETGLHPGINDEGVWKLRRVDWANILPPVSASAATLSLV